MVNIAVDKTAPKHHIFSPRIPSRYFANIVAKHLYMVAKILSILIKLAIV